MDPAAASGGAVSSAAVFLAAATRRTRRIELGTAVISIGYEDPFRLAEDLTTVDVLWRMRVCRVCWLMGG